MSGADPNEKGGRARRCEVPDDAESKVKCGMEVQSLE
jgi:hypothetical protein